jgi:ABC-type multidrug transport system ATPase subunit
MGKETKQILDHIDGWVKPGTCTALMGASGAGKTTLLDVLAARVRTGVVRGDIQVDGRSRDSAFQRKTGYVQQADLHIATATVREALRFSAVLRQPPHIPVTDRIAYVEEVIQLMEMEYYADAVVGVPGEGLNIEQRKRLTIAVELVAKPELLILLDEPTSGLDSQTAWSIMNLLDTLKRNGQAILCTIHQPSATIFQRFDRLLLLEKGQTVYFGDIDADSTTMIRYFEGNGASPCPQGANPAEWMFDVIGTISHDKKEKKLDWSAVWRRSPEYKQVQRHLSETAGNRLQKAAAFHQDDPTAYANFSAPIGRQLTECTYRVFAHYWRSPSYIYSKIVLLVISVWCLYSHCMTVLTLAGPLHRPHLHWGAE